MRRFVFVLCVCAVVFVSACQRRVKGSAVRTGGYASPMTAPSYVRFVCQRDPPNGQQLGMVEATGSPMHLGKIVDEVAKQVSRLGGNVAKVDDVSTRFEIVDRTETYTYACGTNNQTCTGTRTVSEEVGTTQVVGRAFRVETP